MTAPGGGRRAWPGWVRSGRELGDVEPDDQRADDLVTIPHRHGNLQLAAPGIVKYRDDKTDAATALEQALR